MAKSLDLTPAQKRARTIAADKAIAKVTQERMYADAIVGVWQRVEQFIIGRTILRRGRKATKKDEKLIAWMVKQATTVRDTILASAPEEMRPHIIANYKQRIKEA